MHAGAFGICQKGGPGFSIPPRRSDGQGAGREDGEGGREEPDYDEALTSREHQLALGLAFLRGSLHQTDSQARPGPGVIGHWTCLAGLLHSMYGTESGDEDGDWG